MNTPVSTPVPPSAGSLSTLNHVAAKNDNNLIRLNMEMTGLSPENDRIIEVAIAVTDSKLNILAEGPVLVIHQSDELLDSMDAWSKGARDRSGLIDRVKASTTTEAEAEVELLALPRKRMPESKSPMCGNSVCQDRRSVTHYMPKLEEYFHYRDLGISTLREPYKHWQSAIAKGFAKHQRHTAFADIVESIEELRYYREHFIRDVSQTPDAEAPASSVAS